MGPEYAGRENEIFFVDRSEDCYIEREYHTTRIHFPISRQLNGQVSKFDTTRATTIVKALYVVIVPTDVFSSCLSLIQQSTMRHREKQQRQRRMRDPSVLAVLLVAGMGFVSARRDRFTSPPSPSPSGFPTNSYQPSNAPSPLASETPSALSSNEPSNIPTVVPSSMPSTSPPSMMPSVSFTPTTPGPTTSPSSKPSSVPSATPSVAPSSSPSLSGAPSVVPSAQPTSVVSLSLPRILISFVLRDLSPGAGGSRRLQKIDLQELALLLTAFFTNVLQRQGNFRKAFQDIDLETLSTFSDASGEVDVDLSGMAVFQGAQVPSEEELKEVLVTYFSFFGTEDMENFLQDNYSDKQVSGLTLDIDGTQLAGTTETPEPEDDDTNAGLIAGLVVGCCAVALIGAGLLIKHKGGMSKNRAAKIPMDEVSALDDDVGRKSTNSPPRLGVSPRRMFTLASGSSPAERKDAPPPLSPAAPSDMMSSEQDQRSLSGMSGMISLEESLFTTDAESYVRPRGGPGVFEYDASRLDQVISSAKGFAKEMDSEDEAGI